MPASIRRRSESDEAAGGFLDWRPGSSTIRGVRGPSRSAGAARPALFSGSWWVGVGVGLLGLTACAADTTPFERELSRLRQELHGLRASLQSSEARVRRLETRLSDVEVRPPAPERAAEPVSTPAAPKPAKALPVVRLGVQPAEGSDLGARDRGQPPVMIRVRGTRSERLAVDHDVLKKPDPLLEAAPRAKTGGSGPLSASPDGMYEASLARLRKEKDPEAALAGFEVFLDRHPRHHLADNALYWSGEARQMLLQHNAALGLFQALLVRHPQSNKVPWAKLRLAESHLALGDEAQGRATLKSLRSAHPGSEPARIAGDRLAALTSPTR